MWHIKNPEIKKTTLDFTSSEQGKPEVSQLVYENFILMNAIEYTEFSGDSVQLIICDHCGIINCASGGWVCFRKSADFILLIPDFESIEEDEWSSTEYAPPSFYDKSTHKQIKDTPYFDLTTYNNLRKSFPHFPVYDKLQNLKMSEAIRLAQYNMPMRYFGTPPEIIISPNKKNLAVGASKGKAKEILERIEKILKDNYKNDSPALIRKPLYNEEIIYLFLDASEFIDWKTLIRKNEKYFLMLEENFVIENFQKA